ncbi:peptidase inhibitor family I36 protein [Streptomyces iakyrus]|uniref:peptidase inhibitor family I36 protein n=1 Tax=Streptomyces iakyrus TaxID=68219 RepID=UPI00052669BA|nr:peptidase inhibitor family I36 protein [Streptomyces iakyrus]
MRMAKKLAVMAGGMALTGGLLATGAGTAGAAQAAPQAASDCPSGWFCVWAGKNYTGRMQKVEGRNADLTGFVVFQGFKSWYNHGKSCDYKWFTEKNHRGDNGVIPRGAKGTGDAVWFQKSNQWVNCR